MTTREFRDRLQRRARRAGLHVDGDLASRLEVYVRLLALWNSKINLTALPLDPPGDETIDRLLLFFYCAIFIGIEYGDVCALNRRSGDFFRITRRARDDGDRLRVLTAQ